MGPDRAYGAGRLRIAEMRAVWVTNHPDKEEPRNADIAAKVFTDKRGRSLTISRKKALISRWNTGHDFGQLTPGRLKRLAKFLKCTADELLSE